MRRDRKKPTRISSPPSNRRTLGIVALLFGVACWGFTPVILRALTPFLDAWTANGIRYPVSAILYWPLLFFSFRSGRLSFSLLRKCLVPAICALGGQVFFALAFYELQASEVGFLVRLSMVWAVVGSMVLFRDERQLLKRTGFYIGVALIAVGFVGMSMWGALEPPTDSTVTQTIATGNYQLGVLFILLCGAFFGLYMVSVRKCIPNIDPLLSFGIVANFVSVGTIAGMFWKGNVGLLAEQTPYSWSLIIGSSMLGIALGHVMMFLAIQRLGAAITSSCQTLMPFVTAAVASVTLSETLTGWQWAAGSVMVAGAILLLSLKHEISAEPNST